MFRGTCAAALLVFAACFHPTGQIDTTDATSTGPGTSSTSGATEVTVTGSTGDPTTGTSTGTTGLGSTTGAPTGCADAPDPDAYCAALAAGTPHCDLDASTCHECIESADCGSLEGVCDLDAHVCVECVEDLDCPTAAAPACNRETQTCGCTEHSDCPDTACELDLGTCFPKDLTEVLYARADVDPQCAEKICDAAQPCCSVDAALLKGLLTGKGYIVVRVSPPLVPGPKDPGLTIDPTALGKRIALVGTGMPALETSAGKAPLIYVSTAAKVYVAGLTLRATEGGAAVSCVGGTGAWIDDVLVDDLTKGTAFYAAGCPLAVRRAVVKNAMGGVYVGAGGVGRISDTIIAAPSDFALKAETGGTLDVVFSTVFERTGAAGRLLQCFDPGSTITARNSILLANPELGSSVCVDAAVSSSVVTAESLLGPTVTTITPAEIEPLFIDLVGGDLHIKPGAQVLSDVAVRATGDSLTDVDREQRPLGEGALDWAGADRP